MLAVRAAERSIAQAALLPPPEARALAIRAFTLHPLVGSLDAALALAYSVFPDAAAPRDT